jgi:hypothetical protein
MASFTDAISQFRPYVSQLPVEAMREVGMYKQAKYEEGVQKIQGEIDKVAGMDVVRDIDKQYLQSRLNELGSKLKTVAAGDFSNFQLVNSVGGMAKQLIRDENIQNAVASTTKYRKSLLEMEAARKEGKSSPSNEYVFNTAANEWLNSKDISRPFGATYKPYTNWKKEAVEVLKALTKDSTITEEMFTPDGRLADYVVKNKFAGLSPEKIQEALLVGLTPAAMEQMQIDGIYTYANKTPDEFKATVYNDFKQRADYFIKQKNALENAKLNTTSGEQIQKLNQQISSLDKMIAGVQSQYAGLAESLEKGNVEGAKANLFTANQLTNFAKAFSFTETEQTFGQNYAAEMAFKREQANKDWQKFMLTYEQTEKWKKKEYEQEERKIKAEATPMYGGLPQPVSQEDLPKFTLGQITETVNRTRTELANSDAAFAKRNNKDPNKSNEQWISEQRNKWQEGKADPTIAAYFNQTEGKRRNMETDQKMVLDIEREAKNKKYIVDGKEVSAVDLSTIIPAGTTGMSIKTTGGKTLNYTPQELVEFNAKKSAYISSTGGGPGVRPVVTVNDAEARKDMSDKEYSLFKIFTKTGPRTAGDEAVIKKLQDIGKVTGSAHNKLIAAQRDYIADEVTKRVTNMQGVKYSFPAGKTEEKAALGSALVQFADLADKQKGKLPYSPDFNSADLRKISADLASANMTVVEGTTYAPAMYEISAVGKDGTTTRFRVTPEQKMSMFGNLFEAPPEVQAFRPYQEMINKNGGLTTAPNPEEKTSWSNSKLGKIDFPYVDVFGVTGNIEQTLPGQYSIRLNIRDPRTGEVVEDLPWPQRSLATEKEAMTYMRQVNNITAFELLYGRSPSAAEIKQLQKAQTKPF